MTMGIRKIVDEIAGYVLDSGAYACSVRFADGVDPGDYRVRLFFRYDGTNDLSSASGTGLYAVSDNPCDRISYDDWNGVFRRPYGDTTGYAHDSSFNVEVDCEFSGDTPAHELSFVNHAGYPVELAGESVLNGTFREGNLPVNVLLERKDMSVGIVSARYDRATGTVTVETDGPHGFADGDAVSVTGFPTTDHSCGVSGERYNGTYSVTVTGESEFSYRARFYDGFPDACVEYTDCGLAAATRWVVCEYSTERQVLQGVAEALVIWPAHTFRDRDRVTLADGDAVVARNAVIDTPAPNSFVCRSLEIGVTSTVTTVVYAPRTPVSNVPANYSVRMRLLRGISGGVSGSNDVDNSSTRANTSAAPVYPYKYGAFDLASPETGGAVAGDTISVGSGKFGVVAFQPPAAMEHLTGNQFSIYVKVTGSTEVATELCISQMSDSAWTESSNAEAVYSMIYRVPLGTEVIKSDPDEAQTCNYGNTDPFVFRIPVPLSDSWCRAGVPVSLAFTLYGRDGAVVDLGTDTNVECFKVVLSRSEDHGEQVPIPVKVTPSFIAAGDTVSVASMNSKMFDAPVGNYRIRLADEADPSRWVPVSSNSGSTLTFTMPSGYGGNIHLDVMEKPTESEWDSGDARARTVQVTVDARQEVARVMRLNERMKPGAVDRTVSRSASYNRDFGYKGFAEITDENSMIQNLYSCILTRKGERLFNPDFGTTIEERIFSLRTGGNPTDILKECIAALETYEPRIRLVYEQCNITDAGQHGIYLTLGVIVPGGNVQTINIPFRNRGRVV